MAPVGSAPAGSGKWGQRDLAGGMWEWILDWFDYDWYLLGGASCSNCANLVENSLSRKVGRGGCWRGCAGDLRVWQRDEGWSVDRGSGVGARCARSAP
jgi:formylglycine-generating enzyme required for sulfatase activity